MDTGRRQDRTPLQGIDDISPIDTRPEGVFLVRLIDRADAKTASFKSVKTLLQREEQSRQQAELKKEFESSLEAKYPSSPPAAL